MGRCATCVLSPYFGVFVNQKSNAHNPKATKKEVDADKGSF